MALSAFYVANALLWYAVGKNIAFSPFVTRWHFPAIVICGAMGATNTVLAVSAFLPYLQGGA